jgi:tetratricopeptide (TPR) repeat protein
MEFPLCADFSDEILQFTENGSFSGEVVVEYEFLGKKMTVVEPVIVSVNNRNAFMWGDNAALAAFISPDSQEIAAFAKEIAGITRNNIFTGMNANLQYAAGMVEGLRLIGLGYSADAVTPYSEYHLGAELDSIQYPLQTLQYLSGDYDDLGILLCSCLQTVNVPTGYMPLDNDFIVLVKLGISPDSALSNFASTDGLVIDEANDAVYLALSMANLEKGFTASYKAGSDAVAACFSDEESYYEFVDTTDAWNSYKPVAYSNSSATVSPKQDELIKAIKSAIQAYIASDIEAVIKRARDAGDSNKLGVALVRAGRYSEAKREFQKLSTTSAMNNAANIMMIEKNYAGAAAQYKKVLEKDPNNKTALKGLENANAKIE